MQAQRGIPLTCESCGYAHSYKKCLLKDADGSDTVVQMMIDRIIDYAPVIMHDYIKYAHIELHYNIKRKDVSIKLNDITFYPSDQLS